MTMPGFQPMQPFPNMCHPEANFTPMYQPPAMAAPPAYTGRPDLPIQSEGIGPLGVAIGLGKADSAAEIAGSELVEKGMDAIAEHFGSSSAESSAPEPESRPEESAEGGACEEGAEE